MLQEPTGRPRADPDGSAMPLLEAMESPRQVTSKFIQKMKFNNKMITGTLLGVSGHFLSLPRVQDTFTVIWEKTSDKDNIIIKPITTNV